MKGKLSYLLMLLIITLAACGQSPDEQLQSEIKTVSSWTATAQMAAEAWSKGDVPHAYARRTLETAQENFHETTEALKETEEIPANQKSQAEEQISGLRQTINQMQTAVESDDKQALAQSLDHLNKQKQALEAFTKSAGRGY